jgi:serine/threonine-protein kinase
LRLLPGKGDVMRLLAEHLGIGRTVELRLLTSTGAADPLTQRLLEREARVLGAAPHPHIQSVIDSGVDEGRPYVALEALEGLTVNELVADGPLPVERAARLVLQALDGMRALHKRRVVIRGLTPEGVVVVSKREGEVVKLRGLDRVEMLDAEPSGLPVPFSPYVAPEIRRGEDGRDPRVDVYSAGVLFRHLVTGRPQPGAEVEDDLALRAIHRATSEDPDDRFPSAEVCMQAVAVCAGADEQIGPRKLPADPLVRDLHYLTLRRRTQHGTLAEDRREARVELAFVLFCIEAIFRHLGEDVWARLADEVPEVEGLLPASGQSGLHGQQGVPVELFEKILETADHLGGADDLGLLAVVADAMVERGPQRLFPQLGAAPTAAVVVDAAPFLWSRISRQGRAVVQARHDATARIAILEQTGPSLELSGLFAALVRALLRYAAGPRADVSMLACSALGDAADVLSLRW